MILSKYYKVTKLWPAKLIVKTILFIEKVARRAHTIPSFPLSFDLIHSCVPFPSLWTLPLSKPAGHYYYRPPFRSRIRERGQRVRILSRSALQIGTITIWIEGAKLEGGQLPSNESNRAFSRERKGRVSEPVTVYCLSIQESWMRKEVLTIRDADWPLWSDPNRKDIR